MYETINVSDLSGVVTLELELFQIDLPPEEALAAAVLFRVQIGPDGVRLASVRGDAGKVRVRSRRRARSWSITIGPVDFSTHGVFIARFCAVGHRVMPLPFGEDYCGECACKARSN